MGVLVASGLGLAGCGGSAAPAAPVLPPVPGGPAVGQMGAGLESPSPGTPLSQNGQQQALQALAQNLSGYGSATVRVQTNNDYVVQQAQYQNQQYQNQQYQGQFQQPQAVWTHLGNATQEPIQIPTYQVTGYAQGYSISLQMSSRYERGRNYVFTSQVNLAGLILYSTDQVALFEGTSPTGGYALIKVAYRTQNPQLQEYFIDEISSGYGGYNQQNLGRRYHVVQRIIDTAFAYPPQQQQYQQQPQYQQPAGGQTNDYDNNPYF